MTESHKTVPTSLSLWQAMRYWLRLGLVSFGGPGGAIGIMHLELVERLRWISEPRFLHALNYTMVLPGPEAQQLATYIGWLLHGRLGGLIAGILFVAPSLLMIVVLAWLYLAFGDIEWVAASLYGVKPAVTAVILYAIWRIGRRVMRNALLWAVMLAAFSGLYVFHLPFPLIIISAGVLGWLVHWVKPAWVAPSDPQTATADEDNFASALSITRRGVLWLCVAGAGLWVGVYVVAHLIDDGGTLTDMSVFFSKAAVLSFGGAYAVLPYVYQSAVEHFQWITAAQMIDGLALRELIPGPLVMITSFVGFVGGWEGQLLGPDQMVGAGILAAAIAAWYTFLPSFLFIFIGAPYIEQTRHRPAFTAPLTAITAAVVGVMLNLAVMFAGHVIWTHGWEAPPDFNMVLMTGLALLALSAGRVPVVPVMVTCALTGILLTELGSMAG